MVWRMKGSAVAITLTALVLADAALLGCGSDDSPSSGQAGSASITPQGEIRSSIREGAELTDQR